MAGLVTSVAAKLLSGPAVTIRPTAIRDTWAIKLRLISDPHEAICHLCDDDLGPRARDYGPDTRQGCTRWAERHCKKEHGVPLVSAYEVRSGAERW